ncbi:MAG: hypothetical protein AAF382_10240 [Pseudomonadota bacterium]
MRVIFHIGMGKTGTTSIQHALAQNDTALAAHKAHYLGMWFDAIDPKFEGLAGFGRFITQPPEDMASCAEKFHTRLMQLNEDAGAETILISNESLFHNGARLEPFLHRLQELGVELRFLAYLRDPRTWLPSAHTQWALRHKTNKGKVQRFGKSARRLIAFYESITYWLDHFGEMTQVREARVDEDVVADFSQAIGIALTPPPTRALERAEMADTVLRAMFNNRIHQPTLPDRFNRIVRNGSDKPVPSLRDFTALCFDHSETEDVIAENAAVFADIRDRTGLDFLSGEAPQGDPVIGTTIPDEADVQRRVIDYLIDITFHQAQRLKQLERIVDSLQKD